MTVLLVVLGLGTAAWGTTYYVSSSSGSDSNSGTSVGTAWATVAKVNAQNLQPGDSVLFKRGDVWNESLAPLTSGTAASPIAFDAYGTGAPPNFTGYYGVPTSAWVHVSGNAWKAPLPGSYSTVSFCLFGSVWGQKVSPSTSNLKGAWDFYLASGNLYVYSAGSGLSLKFYLSQRPFQQSKPALVDEQYLGPGLDATTWKTNDSSVAISVAAQTLQVNGGTGVDGQTTVQFLEQIELGGALELQHGDVSFTGASQGVLGGLYAGAISAAGCLAGFQVTPAGSESNIRALINGAGIGPVVATTAGHRYLLTSYLYSMEVYRTSEKYHSFAHPAGNGAGGAEVAADVRFVLEVQDVNPSDPASMVAPAIVLYDGVIANAPAMCTYALVNAMNMRCSIAYTYARHISLAEVRTALPNAGYQTQLVESLSDGGQCLIAGGASLDFYPQYVPPLNTDIVVSYRGYGRAVAEVVNSGSVAGLQKGADDGRRGVVRVMKAPSARTQADCENAAVAILDDGAGQAWSGSYQTWSDFLPGGAGDIFPGDGVAVNVPSRSAVFDAIVRRVVIELVDPANDRGTYAVEFANDAAASLALQDAPSAAMVPLQDIPTRLSTDQVGSYYLANLTEAQVTQVTSTTVTVDAGREPGSGFGIEVRAHDYGWGVANDRNLLGRFGSQTFTLPRLGRTQNYFLRLYDNSSPPRYSRYAAALHVDKPL